MNITPTPSNIKIQMPRNERLNALKVKEVMPEAEFTGLSSNVRIDSEGGRWFVNNNQTAKFFSKYDAYAYEWTVGTGKDFRSSYVENHDTENMGFEDFLGYVRENGLDKELNAAAIRADMVGAGQTDYSTVSQQTDYLAAYYAQLENHINLNFSGDEKQAQMKILSDTVGKAIKDLSNAYADYAGGFLEDMGQAGERENIRAGVEGLINDKLNAYRGFIKENPDFASLEGTEDGWLAGSHRFMASELRKAFDASGKTADISGGYSENDLLFIGKIASSLPTDMHGVNRIADEETVGFTLGTVMVKTLELGRAMGVGKNALGTVKGAVSRYQEEYMDLIDREMSRRRQHALNAREREGYGLLDRQAVMNIALKMQVEFENTQSLMKSLFKGVGEGFKAHMQKVMSGSHDRLLRYNENNKGFWHNMYSTLDGKESTSVKIENDALLFESGLEKKNLGVDMDFISLNVGYLTFGGYIAKPEGEVANELPGVK